MGDAAPEEVATEVAWFTGPFERPGMEVYTHLIMAPDDPQRRPKVKGGPRRDVAPHLTLRRSTEDPAARLLALLADGVPRTFHRIGIEGWDLDASILFEGPVDIALWKLVGEGKLECTAVAPILFRVPPAAPAEVVLP
jgi:hypothetical protein